ncbi:MAG: hypothetical protein KIT09_21045 [Bryobacteraceae bacterium]|nr:hypothetical protein [Bryobacteraceae bacterium]
MGPDAVGCAALALVVLAGCATRLNVSLLAPALAVPLALWAGLSAAEVTAAFPWLLFARLAAVTALFTIALTNGTLERFAWLALRAIRFRSALAGPLVFLASMALASSGSGNFAATAMLAPVAMAVAPRLGLSAFLMSVMVAYGATAGAFSPIAPTGLVARALLVRGDVPHNAWTLYFSSLIAHLLVASAVYVAMRGWRSRPGVAAVSDSPPADLIWTTVHHRTAAVLAAFLLVTLLARLPLEWMATGAAMSLLFLRAVKGADWIPRMPWRLIGLVCGVSMLAEVVRQAGGMALFGRLFAAIPDPQWLPGGIAFVSGLVSVTASSIGVVLPAFLPAVTDIVRAAGGGDVTAIAYSINVSAHLVDISPLSPVGAVCVAYVPTADGRQRLFRRLIRMGLAMCFIGAALCQLLFGSPLGAWLHLTR